jgi:hypothetical protein
MGTQWFQSFRTRGQLAGQLPRAVLAAMLVVSTLMVTVAAPAFAAPLAIEPRDIALNLGDLRPGFSPDPRFTREGQLDNVGPMTQVQYQREATPQSIQEGPIVVGQVIIRLDTGIGAGDALIVVRESLMNQNGQSISNAGPNDGGTFTLFKKDGPLEIYSVGFIKETMVIVTLTGGLEGVVSPAGTLELAGISSARLDAALGR